MLFQRENFPNWQLSIVFVSRSPSAVPSEFLRDTHKWHSYPWRDGPVHGCVTRRVAEYWSSRLWKKKHWQGILELSWTSPTVFPITPRLGVFFSPLNVMIPIACLLVFNTSAVVYRNRFPFPCWTHWERLSSLLTSFCLLSVFSRTSSLTLSSRSGRFSVDINCCIMKCPWKSVM